MSYGHSWHRPRALDARLFQRVVQDARVVARALREHDAPLAGPGGKGEPVFDLQCITFNGQRNCPHAVNPSIRQPWPDPDASGVAHDDEDPVLGVWSGATILASRACEGRCDHDTFVLERVLPEHAVSYRLDGLLSGYCRTNFKPYDLGVTCVLLVLKHHLGDEVKVHSEGLDAQWADAELLCFSRVGYGPEYEMSQRDGLTRRFDSVLDSILNAQVTQPPPQGCEGEVEL